MTGGKDNVGKSAFTSLLTYAAISAGAQPYLIDADDQKQTFSLLHGEQVKKIAFLDDPMFEDQPDIIWHLAQQKRDVIVDLAAQSDVYINRWMKSRRLIQNAKREGIKLIKWWVADLDQDSFDKLLSQCARHQQNEMTYVLVQSYYRSRASIWDDVLSSNDVLNAATARNLKTIAFPRMFEGLIDKFRQQQQTIHRILLDEEHENVDMLDRSAVQNWVEEGVEQIESVYQFTAVANGDEVCEIGKGPQSVQTTESHPVSKADETSEAAQKREAPPAPQTKKTRKPKKTKNTPQAVGTSTEGLDIVKKNG